MNVQQMVDESKRRAVEESQRRKILEQMQVARTLRGLFYAAYGYYPEQPETRPRKSLQKQKSP
jgi:hypothetical protein